MPILKSVGWKKNVPVKVAMVGGVLKIGKPWVVVTPVTAGAPGPVNEAQNEVEVGQPTGVVGPNVIPEFWARPKLSLSAKNGGFCQRPWAPMLQAESW